MCWSETASYAMVGLGAASTLLTWSKGQPAGIWGTIGYFTAMEALQAWGYAVVDQCGTPGNTSVTLLSYLHIAFQPIVINIFCMALIGPAITARTRRWVLSAAGLVLLLMLARLIPAEWAGTCPLGTSLCGPGYCTITGTWHIGWQVPLNDLFGQVPGLGMSGQFPDYMLAVFLMPALYGAWRFALFHAIFGPILAAMLTTNPNEMPAIWCLFSIGLILIGISPAIRRAICPPIRVP
jgi:hypothetical protein